jgi:hypothetical protein
VYRAVEAPPVREEVAGPPLGGDVDGHGGSSEPSTSARAASASVRNPIRPHAVDRPRSPARRRVASRSDNQVLAPSSAPNRSLCTTARLVASSALLVDGESSVRPW